MIFFGLINFIFTIKIDLTTARKGHDMRTAYFTLRTVAVDREIATSAPTIIGRSY
jgi:hypothetical protein